MVLYNDKTSAVVNIQFISGSIYLQSCAADTPTNYHPPPQLIEDFSTDVFLYPTVPPNLLNSVGCVCYNSGIGVDEPRGPGSEPGLGPDLGAECGLLVGCLADSGRTRPNIKAFCKNRREKVGLLCEPLNRDGGRQG